MFKDGKFRRYLDENGMGVTWLTVALCGFVAAFAFWRLWEKVGVLGRTSRHSLFGNLKRGDWVSFERQLESMKPRWPATIGIRVAQVRDARIDREPDMALERQMAVEVGHDIVDQRQRLVRQALIGLVGLMPSLMMGLGLIRFDSTAQSLAAFAASLLGLAVVGLALREHRKIPEFAADVIRVGIKKQPPSGS